MVFSRFLMRFATSISGVDLAGDEPEVEAVTVSHGTQCSLTAISGFGKADHVVKGRKTDLNAQDYLIIPYK